MTEPMRMITLWQPWASLVVVGAKPFEFRGKKPPSTIIDQRIVVHAGAARMDQVEIRAMIRALNAGGDEAAELCLYAEPALPVLEKALDDQMGFPGHGTLPWGCGLGTAIVGEGQNGVVVSREHFDADVDLGDAFDANWAWPLSDIFRWDLPVLARGGQGIKFWKEPVPKEQHAVRFPNGAAVVK